MTVIYFKIILFYSIIFITLRYLLFILLIYIDKIFSLFIPFEEILVLKMRTMHDKHTGLRQ